MAAVLSGEPAAEEVRRRLRDAGCTGTLCVQRLEGGPRIELDADLPVTPASVIKVLVAQASLNAMADRRLDPTLRVVLAADRRTPGPVGTSLQADDVEVSARDLVVPMLTISDNAATDALIALVGLSAVNELAASLGLASTRMTADLGTMLDELAAEAGFGDYAGLAAYRPERPGDPGDDEVRRRLSGTAALDPVRGTRTTAADCVRLLRAVWQDAAGPPAACAQVRRLMARQLTRHRIAAGFGPGVEVAAKSGGLLGVVRNEIGVVRLPGGPSYVVGVFTRRDPAAGLDARLVDATIGDVASYAVDLLRR